MRKAVYDALFVLLASLIGAVAIAPCLPSFSVIALGVGLVASAVTFLVSWKKE